MKLFLFLPLALLLNVASTIAQKIEIDSVEAFILYPDSMGYLKNGCPYVEDLYVQSKLNIPIKRFCVVDRSKINKIIEEINSLKVKFLTENCNTQIQLIVHYSDMPELFICLGSNGCVSIGSVILHDVGNRLFNSIIGMSKSRVYEKK